MVKNLPVRTGDAGSVLESGRSPGEENSNLLQCSFLENPMDRGVWWATVHGVAKSQTRECTHTDAPSSSKCPEDFFLIESIKMMLEL